MVAHIPPIDEAWHRVLTQPFVESGDWAAISITSMNLVYRRLRAGEIPSVRQGQRYRIPSSWIRQQALIEPIGGAA